jgi:hypothetical protein
MYPQWKPCMTIANASPTSGLIANRKVPSRQSLHNACTLKVSRTSAHAPSAAVSECPPWARATQEGLLVPGHVGIRGPYTTPVACATMRRWASRSSAAPTSTTRASPKPSTGCAGRSATGHCTCSSTSTSSTRFAPATAGLGRLHVRPPSRISPSGGGAWRRHASTATAAGYRLSGRGDPADRTRPRLVYRLNDAAF